MNVQITQHEHCDVVKMAGRVDSYTSQNLEEALDGLIEKQRTNIVFDMIEVDFLSSKGIHTLLETQKKCRQNNGKLVLAGANDRILELFKLIVLDGYFETFDDLTAAVGSFETKSS